MPISVATEADEPSTTAKGEARLSLATRHCVAPRRCAAPCGRQAGRPRARRHGAEGRAPRKAPRGQQRAVGRRHTVDERADQVCGKPGLSDPQQRRGRGERPGRRDRPAARPLEPVEHAAGGIGLRRCRHRPGGKRLRHTSAYIRRQDRRGIPRWPRTRRGARAAERGGARNLAGGAMSWPDRSNRGPPASPRSRCRSPGGPAT